MSLHLFYDPKKGLVKQDNYACGCYIQEHDEKGREAPHHEQTLVIPERNVKIVVRTNLHYGGRSYMYATMTMMDKTVLNFLDTSYRHSVKIVHAEPGNWDMLFDGIIELYNNIFNIEKPINTYFDGLVEEIVGEGGGTVDKMVNVTTRLAEVADGISESVYYDNPTLRIRLRKTCGLVIRHISKNWGNTTWITEGKHKTLEENLHCILKYLTDSNEVLYALTKSEPRSVVK